MAVIESRSRGVLDRPVEPGDDKGGQALRVLTIGTWLFDN
jgi:hypothetical protein